MAASHILTELTFKIAIIHVETRLLIPFSLPVFGIFC